MGSVAGKNDLSSVEPTATYRRQAKHAGSWYEDDRRVLAQTLQGFLDRAELDSNNSSNINNARFIAALDENERESSVRALIVPHAGYSYSGPTAAYAYRALLHALSSRPKESPIGTTLVLHPSHHVYLDTCAVSNAHTIETR
jgi:MEMO1 family protein